MLTESQQKLVNWLTEHCKVQTGNYIFSETMDRYVNLYEKKGEVLYNEVKSTKE